MRFLKMTAIAMCLALGASAAFAANTDSAATLISPAISPAPRVEITVTANQQQVLDLLHGEIFPQWSSYLSQHSTDIQLAQRKLREAEKVSAGNMPADLRTFDKLLTATDRLWGQMLDEVQDKIVKIAGSNADPAALIQEIAATDQLLTQMLKNTHMAAKAVLGQGAMPDWGYEAMKHVALPHPPASAEDSLAVVQAQDITNAWLKKASDNANDVRGRDGLAFEVYLAIMPPAMKNFYQRVTADTAADPNIIVWKAIAMKQLGKSEAEIRAAFVADDDAMEADVQQIIASAKAVVSAYPQ